MNNEEMTRRMEEANALAQQQHQQLLLQHQQQQHQQLLRMQQQFQQHQQPLTRFSSNSSIPTNNSHPMQQQPRNSLLQHNHILQQQQQQQQGHQQQQQQRSNLRQGFQTELEMAQQDAWKVCNPDVKRPFSSLEDACERLLPYHVVADHEADEDDRILDSDTTGQLLSRSQVWDQNIVSKVGEFTGTFEKHMHVFNSLLKKRAQGEMRSEERLMIEQIILQDERRKLIDIQAEIEAREKAGREAAEAKMRIAIAQAEQARAEAQAHAEVLARAEAVRAEAAARVEAARMEALAKVKAEEHTVHEPPMQEQGVNMEDILHGWGTLQREDDAEPSEDFLNDDHDPETVDDRGFQNMEVGSANGMHDDWREVGELDLNMR